LSAVARQQQQAQMSTQGSAVNILPDLQRGFRPAEAPARWGLAAFSGRFAEILGGEASAALTLAVGLVAEAQQCGEPAAWVSRCESSFYPPDVAAAGVDLQALVVVWVPGPGAAARAADHLLRSGAFGLVVLDLGGDARIPTALQTRLNALARREDAALVCLTAKERPESSLGSLVSLRAEALRTGRTPQGFRCAARILKDKRLGPGRTFAEICRGPDGLC